MTKATKFRVIKEHVLSVVIDMYDDGKGIIDPTLEEIATAFAKAHGSTQALVDVEWVEGDVRADLATLLNAAGNVKYFVVPLNPSYYLRFRATGVTTINEAERCIAGRGRGSRTAGFIFIEGTDHPLLQAYLDTHASVTAGKARTLGRRIKDASDSGRLVSAGPTNIVPLLTEARDQSEAALKAVK